MVIGHGAFSEEALADTVFLTSTSASRWLPQEGFLDQVLFGYDWWCKHPSILREVALNHPGLQYVQSLGISLPPQLVPETLKPTSVEAIDFADESFLHRMGYNVASNGPSRHQRRRILSKAVELYGLPPVAHHIASLTRLRKMQPSGRYKFRRAIAEWENDLHWLQDTQNHDGFMWPTTEP